MKDIPILKFEYYEQLLKLRSLERENIIKKAKMGVGGEDRLDRYEDSAWEFAQQEELGASAQLIDLKYQISRLKKIEIDEIVKPIVIQIGSFVKLKNINENTEKLYLIAGTNNEDRLSINSPLAKQLLGKKQYQTVGVITPQGFTKYFISEIQWGVREYLKKYLPKYIQKEIPGVGKINLKVPLDDPEILKVPEDASRRDLVEVLQKKNYLENIADKIEYIIAITREYRLSIPELDQCKLVLGKIKSLFKQFSIPYTSHF